MDEKKIDKIFEVLAKFGIEGDLLLMLGWLFIACLIMVVVIEAAKRAFTEEKRTKKQKKLWKRIAFFSGSITATFYSFPFGVFKMPLWVFPIIIFMSIATQTLIYHSGGFLIKKLIGIFFKEDQKK